MRGLFVAVCLTAISTAGSAQVAEPGRDYWIDVLYPKVFPDPSQGMTVGGHYALIQPLRSEDWETPPPYRISLSLDGQAQTSGSRFARFEARAPGLIDGWRFVLRLGANRRARDNYFGIGNDTEFVGDSSNAAQPNFYRALNTTYVARGEVHRRLTGNWRVVWGFEGRRWTISPLPGPSVLRSDLAAGVDPTIGVPTYEASLRTGLVFDTRDDEVAPERGVLLEAIVGGADASVLGDVSFTRFTASGAGYLTLSPQWQFAGRVLGQTMGGTPRLGTLYVIESVDRPLRGLGGSSSHRALRSNRLLGRHKLLANFETRFTFFADPTLSVYRVALVGFIDAGRVFEDQNLTLTTDGMKYGGGVGLFLQIGRAAVLGLSNAIGPDGFRVNAHTRWMF